MCQNAKLPILNPLSYPDCFPPLSLHFDHSSLHSQMASALLLPALCFSRRRNPIQTPRSDPSGTHLFRFSLFSSNRISSSPSIRTSGRRSFDFQRTQSISAGHVFPSPMKYSSYEFVDGFSDVELRLEIVDRDVTSPKDIVVDVDDLSLKIEVRTPESCVTLMETNNLYGRIKPSETIWYIDEDQLVVNLKKYHTDLKWPDLLESWSSLTEGVAPLLKGTSIYLVGDSTEINQKVARELASGIGYVPLLTSELLERYAQQPVDSWLMEEGVDSVAEAEAALVESLSSQVRVVVATLGGQHGAARRDDKWRHLYAGFTIWLSESEAIDEISAKEEARKHIEDGILAYSNAEVVLKLGGWEHDSTRTVAQACLSALKQLVLSDKTLTGKKSLYIRGGCRGDWPNIRPPGWDPSSGDNHAPDA